MYQLLASPLLDSFIVLHPGSANGLKISPARYQELRQATQIPGWLADAARQAWGLRLHDQSAADSLLIRGQTAHGYARASYEPSLGCNYGCVH